MKCGSDICRNVQIFFSTKQNKCVKNISKIPKIQAFVGKTHPGRLIPQRWASNIRLKVRVPAIRLFRVYYLNPWSFSFLRWPSKYWNRWYILRRKNWLKNSSHPWLKTLGGKISQVIPDIKEIGNNPCNKIITKFLNALT